MWVVSLNPNYLIRLNLVGESNNKYPLRRWFAPFMYHNTIQINCKLPFILTLYKLQSSSFANQFENSTRLRKGGQHEPGWVRIGLLGRKASFPYKCGFSPFVFSQYSTHIVGTSITFLEWLSHLKCLNVWNNKSFDMLFEMLKESLPVGGMLSKNQYE